jgi:hypothetical protein
VGGAPVDAGLFATGEVRSEEVMTPTCKIALDDQIRGA